MRSPTAITQAQADRDLVAEELGAVSVRHWHQLEHGAHPLGVGTHLLELAGCADAQRF
jgi:hypothetical protein